MRPVNLIPPEDRHGQNAPLRTGPVAYVLLGALVLVLMGVTALVLTGNQISERKSEVAELKREDSAAKAEAARLAAYSQFQALHEQRLATITSLADSRFDWSRVMRELALILPHDVWLTSLEATAGGGEGEGGGSTSAGVSGPSLSISGCAVGHPAVAGFVTALKEIDGVTRVEMQFSELAGRQAGSGSSGSGSSSDGGGCQVAPTDSQFSMTIAFDAAPLPATDSESSAPVTATEKSEANAEELSGEGEEDEAEGSEGG